MKEQKPRLFDFTPLRLVSAREFLGILKTGFFCWLFAYGFFLLIYFAFGWLSDFAGDITGVVVDKWVDPIFHKSVGFWIIIAFFAWVVFAVGIKSLFKQLGEFFTTLSKFPKTEIIVAIILFAILPLLLFLYLIQLP